MVPALMILSDPLNWISRWQYFSKLCQKGARISHSCY